MFLEVLSYFSVFMLLISVQMLNASDGKNVEEE